MGWTELHFLRPLWLLAIPLLAVLPWLMPRWRRGRSWEEYISRDKLAFLSVGGRSSSARLRKWGVLAAWVVASVALAGPSWQKTPHALLENRQAVVVLFDLSPSMLARDITPDRITRARLKLIDFLRLREDGETGLIAYAGYPHRVSPLTDDADNIEALVPSLHPDVMPVPGSNPEAAVTMALEMFEAAGIGNGDILLISDGMTTDAVRAVRTQLPSAFRLSVLGVGTPEGAPIPLARGGFMRNAGDNVVVARLSRDALRDLAASSGGRYVELQADDSDLEYLNDIASVPFDAGLVERESRYDSWHDAGYWLVLLLLPAVALAFRRNLVWCLVALPLAPDAGWALEWDDLWSRPDQQGARALADGDASKAAELFESRPWSGVASYRDKDYAAAAEKFAEGDGASNHFNRGNALALAGDLQAALDSYDAALKIQPDMQDAQHNKEVVERLLREQQQNQQGGQSQDQQGNQDQSQAENQDSGGQSGSNQPQNQESQTPQSDSQSDSEDSSSEQPANSDASQSRQSESGDPRQDSSPPATDQPNAEPSGPSEASPQPDSSEPQREGRRPQPADPDSSDPGESEFAVVPEDEHTPLDPASEQWLRTIPDDPGGLLRRKFKYQSDVYRRSRRYSGTGSEAEQRY